MSDQSWSLCSSITENWRGWRGLGLLGKRKRHRDSEAMRTLGLEEITLHRPRKGREIKPEFGEGNRNLQRALRVMLRTLFQGATERFKRGVSNFHFTGLLAQKGPLWFSKQSVSNPLALNTWNCYWLHRVSLCIGTIGNECINCSQTFSEIQPMNSRSRIRILVFSKSNHYNSCLSVKLWKQTFNCDL